MQELKDDKVIIIQTPKANPHGKMKLPPDEQKLVSLIAKIIVDKTLNESTIHPGVDSSPDKEFMPAAPFAP
ncbi:hypothetical protein [Agriterribacter sp.]|uniref:hypothetical protein n=1 Tax=Agriterribacter sp. TaxID=2821509 RepID=UPI002BDA32A8|nr:hypothetical protein [Agriterribacter sp.]HRO45126.1 hypothetical protein [Agriterribacter sp.]HRQ15433.1 hypothetical protein [Agriterribacter sp.]